MRINWLNYLFLPIDGYGRFGLSMVRALVRAGVDVYPACVDALEHPGWLQRLQGLDLSKLTVALMPPNHLLPVAGRQWNYAMYEALALPDGWGEHVNKKAERLIVPSPFLIDVFRKARVSVPIHVAPGGIDPEECPVLPCRCSSDRPYTFMALGDRGSRKGMDTVWSAFFAAFGDYRDVRLIVKCRPGSLPYLDLTRSDPRVSLWREDVTNIADIYAQADCYVFPTKGEGFGLPPREAAACGLPVICTEWGGTADCESWAIPVKTFTLRPSQLIGGGDWARPDVDEVAAHMTWCYEHQDDARAKGQAAAAWLRANQTWAHSASKLIELFREHV